ncbi:hypothetical protein BD779DRAFT_1448209, partial [Infundibulicybe gibba]
ATKCKGSQGGIRCYQDSQDRAGTSNLKTHAIKCFGSEIVNSAFGNFQTAGPDCSIFAAFAQLGQQPTKFSQRPHTPYETRSFHCLMKAGRPGLVIPSPSTVSRDIKASFEGCRAQIDTMIQETPGHVHFATDAWTSPNHCAFVAWTVHFQHEGHILAFLLDVVEVPEVSPSLAASYSLC